MFNKTLMTFLVTGLLCLGVQATPVAREEELVILRTEQTANGTLTFWGVADGATSKPPSAFADLEKRQCGSNDVICSGDHTAGVTSCEDLLADLQAHPGTPVNESPRSICRTTVNEQCCVSWANPVPGLVEFNLVSAASKILNFCGVNPRVSGLARNVNLNGVCTTQCLSNRPNGCTN
jgi:hypothetical protein